MLRHGQLSQSYAVVVDPNPDDPKAVAVGGFMPNGSPTTSEVFLVPPWRVTGMAEPMTP